MGKPQIVLEAGETYHIYNYAVGSDQLFKEEENYRFFLEKYFRRIPQFADTLAYCLLPNQFHFIIRIKDKTELTMLWLDRMQKLKMKWERIPDCNTADYLLLDHLILTEIANLCNGYVQAFNKVYGRRGTLLCESFQRTCIDNDSILMLLICDIHNYPVGTGLVKRRDHWKHSSYKNLISSSKTNLIRNDVLKLFRGKENFIHLHDSR